MEYIDVPAVAKISQKDLVKDLSQLEACEINDLIMDLVREKGNPRLARNFADCLMHHYKVYKDCKAQD